MDPTLAFCYRDPLDAVYSRLELQHPIGIFAMDHEDNLLIATGFRRAFTYQLRLKTVGFTPARIHAVKVATEQAGLVTAGGGPDLDDAITPIVGIFRDQHILQCLGGCANIPAQASSFIFGHFGDFPVRAIGKLMGFGQLGFGLEYLIIKTNQLFQL